MTRLRSRSDGLHPYHCALPGAYSKSYLSSYRGLSPLKLHELVSSMTLENASETVKAVLRTLKKIEELKVQTEPLLKMRCLEKALSLALHTSKGETKAVFVLQGAQAVAASSLEGSSWSTDSSPIMITANSTFTLPLRTRRKLLSIAAAALDLEGSLGLESYSNRALPGASPDDLKFYISWRALCACLLRTNPTIDETVVAHRPSYSPHSVNAFRSEQVDFIHRARHFFFQGRRGDCSSGEIFNSAKRDLRLFHSCVCFRAQSMMTLFMPTSSSSEFYEAALPIWSRTWSGVDYSREWDCNWLTLFCRARKYVSEGYDWSSIRRQVLSRCTSAYLCVPMGNLGDPSFKASPVRRRTFSKTFSFTSDSLGSLLSKLSKLMIFWLGRGSRGDGDGDGQLSANTQEILKFWEYIAPYYNPSNFGNWTANLGIFLQYVARSLAMRVGRESAAQHLSDEGNSAAASLSSRSKPLPPSELLRVVASLLPLAYETIYSKHPAISQCGDSALRSLAGICAGAIISPTLDFAVNALGSGSIHQTHQAPRALCAMKAVIGIFVRARGRKLWNEIPALMNLSLNGIDCNDDKKTIVTCSFFSEFLSWVPVGCDGDLSKGGWGEAERSLFFDVSGDPQWKSAASALPETSALRAAASNFESDRDDVGPSDYAEMSEFVSDWALQFLDRIYALYKSASPMVKKKEIGESGRCNGSINMRARQDTVSAWAPSLTCIVLLSSLPPAAYVKALSSIREFVTGSTHPNALKQGERIDGGFAGRGRRATGAWLWQSAYFE